MDTMNSGMNLDKIKRDRTLPCCTHKSCAIQQPPIAFNPGSDSIPRMLPLNDLSSELLDKIAGELPINALMEQVDLTATALVHMVLLGRAANVDVEHAKLLRALNREGRIRVAKFLLRLASCNFYDQPDPGYLVPHMKRPAEGRLLDVCIQWVGLTCIQILNTNENGTAWTIATKMKVFVFLRSSYPSRSGSCAFVSESLDAWEPNTSTSKNIFPLAWQDFGQRLSHLLVGVCEAKGFDPKVMQKLVQQAGKSFGQFFAQP